MTPDEFREKAEEFARMYVSDYATDVRVVVDDQKDWNGDEPQGSIDFESYGRDEWSVPICVDEKGELELDIPDCPGHTLDPQNFYVYLWGEACKRKDRVADDLATTMQAEEYKREKLSKALKLDPLDPLTGAKTDFSMLALVATAKTESLRLAEAQVERLLKRLAEALYDLESGELSLEFSEQTDDVKDAYRKMAKEEAK